MAQQPLIDAKLRSLLPILNDIKINNPCSADWDSMTGTERQRHCAYCDKAVHDLEHHTAAEAVGLVAGPETNVCVRVLRDPEGNVVTSDSPRIARSLRRDFFCRLGLLAASVFGLTRVFGREPERTHSRVSGSLTSTRQFPAAPEAPTATARSTTPKASASPTVTGSSSLAK